MKITLGHKKNIVQAEILHVWKQMKHLLLQMKYENTYNFLNIHNFNYKPILKRKYRCRRRCLEQLEPKPTITFRGKRILSMHT